MRYRKRKKAAAQVMVMTVAVVAVLAALALVVVVSLRGADGGEAPQAVGVGIVNHIEHHAALLGAEEVAVPAPAPEHEVGRPVAVLGV